MPPRVGTKSAYSGVVLGYSTKGVIGSTVCVGVSVSSKFFLISANLLAFLAFILSTSLFLDSVMKSIVAS
jgi:hypothetical protein